MIYFIHIPKTAGTSFYEVVKKNHGTFLKPKWENAPEQYLIENLRDKKNVAVRLPGGYETAPEVLKIIKDLSSELIENINFIGGHTGYGVHEQLAVEVKYISFIRDPIKRLFSDFKEHHKEGRYFYEPLKSSDFSLNTYLELLLKNRLDNILTRQIAGPYNFFLDQKDMSDEVYTRAVNNIFNVSFFQMSNFEESLIKMHQLTGWKYLNYNKQNVSKETIYNLDHDENLLNKVIDYDLKLYSIIDKDNSLKLKFTDKIKLKYFKLFYR